MIAHRGLSGIERENTIAAFVAAANRSYFGIETDVHVTKDKKFVIIHDETTDRVSLEKYKINVEENEYCALENVILPDKDGSFVRSDIRIPLLAEYISICKKYGKICVLEIKNRFETEDIRRMVEEIGELGYLDGMIFISFSLENCLDLRAMLPEAKIQWLIGGNKELGDRELQIFVDNKLDIDIYHKRLTKELVGELHAKGIEVNCWTCDNAVRGEELVEMGVDYITSDILE